VADYSSPEPTAESRRRYEEGKKQRQLASDALRMRATAEGRRLLLTGQSAGMEINEFQDEINARLGTDKADEVVEACHALEDNDEMRFDYIGHKRQVAPLSPKSPDIALLSEAVVQLVPSSIAEGKDEFRVSANRRRSDAVNSFFLSKIQEGTTILLRDPDGVVTEVVFTTEALKE
jgi:hypothetical protein